MTINNKITYQVIDSTDTKDPYPFNITFLDKESIKVSILSTEGVKEDLSYNQDYTVTDSGYIIFLKKHPTKGQKIIVQRKSKNIQNVSFPPNVTFKESSIEKMGDKIVMQIQEIANNNFIKIPSELDNISTELPHPGRALVWNIDGTKLVNGSITGESSKDDIPNPSNANPGNLIRVNSKRSSYELFDIGIKEPKNAEPYQILRVSEDKKKYEFSFVPKFLKASDDDVGKVVVLSKEDELSYLGLDEKELVANLEFEKNLTYGNQRSNDLTYDSNGFNGSKYELKFTYDKLDLKENGVRVFAYLAAIDRIKTSNISTGNLTKFLIETFNEKQKYQNLKTRFEFSVEKMDKRYTSSKTIGPGIDTIFLKTSDFPYQLKIKASIYKPLL